MQNSTFVYRNCEQNELIESDENYVRELILMLG